MEGIGFGLTTLAFWGFLAAVVVAGTWQAARERREQHETMRRIVESGRDIDPDVIDRIFRGDKRPDRDLKIAGLITIFASPGLAILGWFLSWTNEKVLMVLLGVAALVACVGVGLLVASKVAERLYSKDKTNVLQ